MKYKILSLLVVVFVLSACGGGYSSMEPEIMYNKSAPLERVGADAFSGSGDSLSEVAYYEQDLSTQESHTRMVIKNASLSIVVEEPGITMDSITKLAAEMGGFVVSSNLYQIHIDGGVEVPQANITIRVPAEKLDQALTEIKSGAGEILNETVSGQDVTQEYTDLGSRLRNLENAEEQLQEIMDQAWETEDVLTVYNRLVEVQEQIELIKGQMQYYEQSADLSAISVNIQANEAVQPLKIGNWQPVGVAKRALQALINTLEVIANMLIWIGLYILPVVLILFFPVRWIWRWIKRLNSSRKEKNAQKKAQKEESK